MTIRFLCIAVFLLKSIQLNATTVEALGGPFPIPDNDPAGIDIQFGFSGFAEEVFDLSLTLEVQHTFIADISATLTSPNGEAQMVIFSRVGTGLDSQFGDSANLDGTYLFTDVGDDMWLSTADLVTSDVLPSGTYRTSTAGQPLLSNYGGHRTSLSGVFGDLISGSDGVSGDGIWVLNISDNASFDTGTVTSASLTLNAPEIIFNNGFEGPDSTGSLPRNRMDFNGNGLADFGVLKKDETPMNWRILDNTGGGTTGSEINFDLGVGELANQYLSADFDGDGIADAAVWDDATAQYSIRRSSRPGATALTIPVGVTGDETRALMGDYDGDGIDDPASFTTTGATGEQRTLFYVRSSDGVSVSIPMGLDEGADSTPFGGEDFTGDGRADLLLRTGQDYVVRDGQTGAVVDMFTFSGTFIGVQFMIGNFAGDNRADVTQVSNVSGNLFWETRETGPGTISPAVELGAIIAGNSEFAAQADYDGDGYQDYGVWRRDNTNPDSAQFIYIPSTDPATTTTVTFGTTNESPVAIGQSNN